jgi:predicted nucleotidyltransferase
MRIDVCSRSSSAGTVSTSGRVREVSVFGSYARGALEVGDVDSAVEFDQTKDEAARSFATMMASGIDHLAALRCELRRTQRGLEIRFNDFDELHEEGSSVSCSGDEATRSSRRALDSPR